MKKLKRILPLLSAAFSVVCLLLLLVDLIAPGLSLFLRPAVKLLVLACCVAAIAGSGALLASTRRRLARRGRTRGAGKA